jgi:general secretion pathway protein K
VSEQPGIGGDAGLRRQRGVALLTALLVVFLTTVAAVSLVYKLQLSINRSAVLLGQRQALYYALGGEAWAGQILRRDAEDSEFDHGNEDWAQAIATLPIEGGSMSGSIVDEQGRFNVNGLITEDGELDELRVEQMRSLLTSLELEPDLAMAIVDWIDDNEEPSFPGGVEATEYMSKKPPYRTADGPMVSTSELRLINGMDAESYRKLLPHVTTLPTQSPINVNAATVPVLMSLHPDLSQADAETLREHAESEGFETVDDFLGHEAVSRLELEPEDFPIAVSSSYFRVLTRVETGYGRLSLESLLEREGSGTPRVIRRVLGRAG